MKPMTIGQLRETLALLGSAHDNKPVAVLDPRGHVTYLAAAAACQGDRILFEAAQK